jgi:hypothetical protein
MPTLEDTVDFKVATLNDLLDADVRTGVPVAADDKYKRWAFLSTGLAGMLLIALIVSLVTGGSDSGGGNKASKEIAAPPNTAPVTVNAGTSLADTDITPGSKVTLYDEDGQIVASGGTVLKVTETKLAFPKGAIGKSLKVAVTGDEVKAVTAASSGGRKIKVVEGTQAKTTPTTAPAAGAAPTPIEPAPATTPTS